VVSSDILVKLGGMTKSYLELILGFNILNVSPNTSQVPAIDSEIVHFSFSVIVAASMFRRLLLAASCQTSEGGSHVKLLTSWVDLPVFPAGLPDSEIRTDLEINVLDVMMQLLTATECILR
jgi:hypothetical protein